MPYSDPKVQRAYLTKYSRTWYWRNREKDLARQKKWRADNKELLKVRRKRFREENKDRLAAEQRARRERDPERNLLIWRKSHYKTHYGISIADYDAMLSQQAGGCAICGAKKSGGRFNRFSVDHCHTSGKVRGLLCVNCNMRLGWFEEHQSGVLNYLMRHAQAVA